MSADLEGQSSIESKKQSDEIAKDACEKKSLLEAKTSPETKKKDSKKGFLSEIYNSEYREFLGRDALGWLKLSCFYTVFYIWLAGFFCTMLFMFWVVRIRDQPLPVYYNTESVMHYKSVNPGLGFRPHLNPETDTIYIKVVEADKFVKSFNNFLEDYEKNKDSEFINGLDKKVKFNYEEIIKDSPCSKENKFGLASNSPCVAIKLNRIIGWKPESAKLEQFPIGLNETVKLLEERDMIERETYVYVACSGQNDVDRDNIGEVEYYSSHFSHQIGGINFKYFPYMNQDNYISPLVFVHFKKVSMNILINVVCKAYAGNIDNADNLNQRGMVKFNIFVDDRNKSEDL